MARPAKNIVDYFPHSCKHKQTMFIIKQNYGNDGYAFWFELLEILGSTPGHYLDCRSLPTWKYLLSYTNLTQEKALDILTLFCELNAIDAELWQKHNIIWVQNFVDGISDVYRNRRAEIPQKPNKNGSSNDPATLTNLFKFLHPEITRNPNHAPVSTSDNPNHAPVSTSKSTQSKVKKSIYTISKDIEPKGSQNNNFKKLNELIKSETNKVGVLITAFKEWHSDAPPEDFEILGGYMGKLFKQSGDSGYLLKIIWDTASISPAGSHLNYISGILKSKKKDNHTKSMADSMVNDPEKFIKGKYGHMVKR